MAGSAPGMIGAESDGSALPPRPAAWIRAYRCRGTGGSFVPLMRTPPG